MHLFFLFFYPFKSSPDISSYLPIDKKISLLTYYTVFSKMIVDVDFEGKTNGIVAQCVVVATINNNMKLI